MENAALRANCATKVSAAILTKYIAMVRVATVVARVTMKSVATQVKPIATEVAAV